MTWKRMKRKSLASLQRIRTNLDSWILRWEHKTRCLSFCITQRVVLGKDRWCFPCCELLRSLHKQILGIGTGDVTILHTNIWASVSSRVQSHGRHTHWSWTSAADLQPVGHRDRLGACCCHPLWLEQLDIDPNVCTRRTREWLVQ